MREVMLNKTEDDERSDGEDDETRDRRGVWVEMHHETSDAEQETEEEYGEVEMQCRRRCFGTCIGSIRWIATNYPPQVAIHPILPIQLPSYPPQVLPHLAPLLNQSKYNTIN